ncbi:HAD family hydrolase [Saccharibacillus qingshengii]|uniref:HAD family hydrolase n=1 Tax=Saccharibacillus qingshengii TaxID=1763540 RepID=UPI001FE5BEDD|nr:HAD family phosphatase [Saccharibacillus qingshengii]
MTDRKNGDGVHGKPDMPDAPHMHKIDFGNAGAILFDKDGTLLDFTAMWGFWSDRALDEFRTLLAERGLKMEAQQLSQIWGTQHDEEGRTTDYDRRGPLAMGTVDEMHAILAWHGYRAGLSWAEAKILVRRSVELADAAMEAGRPAKLLPGVREFLERCRESGVPMGVVTADETASALRHLEWLGITDYFRVVIGTDQAQRGKPFPDLCLLACERLGVPPERVIVIGDTDGDMEMARAAGAALKIGIGEAAALKLADWTVPSFERLLESAVPR